jgi:uncharacterized lipoprotein
VRNVLSTRAFATGNEHFRIDMSNISQGVTNVQYKAYGAAVNNIPGRQRDLFNEQNADMVSLCVRNKTHTAVVAV